MNPKMTGILFLAALFMLSACSLNRDGAKSPQLSKRPSAEWNQNSETNSEIQPDADFAESRIAAEDDSVKEGAEGTTPARRSDRVLEPAGRPIVPAFPVRMMEEGHVSLQTVFFNFDSASISPKTKAALETNLSWMRKNPQARVQVGGHCDERGTSEYNLGLGMRRSNQVRDYLISRGVSPHRLTVMSYGEEMPLRYGHNEGHWKFNRRVEFRLIEPTAKR